VTKGSAVGSQLKETSVYGFNIESAAPTSLSFLDGSKVIGAENAAKLAFVRKAKAVNRQFQGGVFLGELTEAIRMVKRPANALRNGMGGYLDALKKRRRFASVTPRALTGVSASRRFQRILSDTWLEYSFGWTPLLSDIDNGMKAIANHVVSPSRPRLVVCAGKGSYSEFSVSQLGYLAQNLAFFNGNVVTERKVDVKFYGAVRAYNPSNVPFRYYGVSLQEFIPTAWELVPWSFFVDYFANIGDILECSTLIRSDISWVNRGIKQSETLTHYCGALNTFGVPTVTGYCSGSPAKHEYAEVFRTRWDGSLIPILQSKLPNTGRKLANITALLPKLKSLTPFR
jgi:hypothetical protein